MRSRWTTLGWCALAQGCTVAGGGLGLALAPHMGSHWVTYPLAVAGGCFFYLGFHAVHEEWKRRGAGSAFVPALTGGAAAAVLQRGFHAIFGV
jgi:zinc transporter ZupT